MQAAVLIRAAAHGQDPADAAMSVHSLAAYLGVEAGAVADTLRLAQYLHTDQGLT